MHIAERETGNVYAITTEDYIAVVKSCADIEQNDHRYRNACNYSSFVDNNISLRLTRMRSTDRTIITRKKCILIIQLN